MAHLVERNPLVKPKTNVLSILNQSEPNSQSGDTWNIIARYVTKKIARLPEPKILAFRSQKEAHERPAKVRPNVSLTLKFSSMNS